MSSLEELLDDSTVDVVDTSVDLDRSAFEGWRETVEARENRAVSGIVRDGDRVLFVRRPGENRRDGWRLPGSDVGQVRDFEAKLREELASLGIGVEGVEPMRIHRHTGRHDGATASLYYVLCEVDLEGDQLEAVERSITGEDLRGEWFAEPPEAVVNEEVVDRLFDAE